MLLHFVGESDAGVGEMESAPLALNYQTILARVDGNAALLRELVDMFMADAPQWMGDIHEAVAQKNVPRLKAVVHLLRGSLGIFGPSVAYEAARQLEALADSGCLAGAEPVCARLEKALPLLQRAVSRLVQNVPDASASRRPSGPFLEAIAQIPLMSAVPAASRREDCR